MSIQAFEMTLIDYLKFTIHNRLSTARSAVVFDDTVDDVVDIEGYMNAFDVDTIYSFTTPGEKPEDVKGYELHIMPFLDSPNENLTYAEPSEVKFAVGVATMDFDTLSEPVNVDYKHIYPFLTQGEFDEALDKARASLRKVMKDAGIAVNN